MPVTASLIALLLTAGGGTPSFGLDRVDLLSEDAPHFLHYDIPTFGTAYDLKSVRFVEQVKLAFTLPVEGLYLGVSIASQSLTYEFPLSRPHGLFATGSLQTRLLFPHALMAGVAWRVGFLRLGLSLNASTNGDWGNPGLFAPNLFPTLGLGIGHSYRP